ncbi:MAG: hypothetical protein LC097_12400 [Burkholderiales bacterium]|nr:hypothetical protein [Burkholderiales bacterium]
MWNIFRQSIRTQLLFLLCVAMLPLLALLFFQNHRERADARNDAFARVRMVAEQTAQRLNQYLVDHEGVLARIAASPGVRALDGQACDPLIHEFVRLFPEYTNLAVQDLQGAMTARSSSANSRPRCWSGCPVTCRRTRPTA